MGALCLSWRPGAGEGWLCSYLNFSKCLGMGGLFLLPLRVRVLTLVALPRLERGCGSLDGALGPPPSRSSAPVQAAASLSTRCGPEVD